jgi:carboxyl-terminal processing protease
MGAQVADTTRTADSVFVPYSQEGSAGTSEEEANLSQVFLGAFKTILDYHQTTFSDSLLWEEALDGLIEGLDDPYAAVFTPSEYGEFQEDNTGNYAGIGVQISRLNDRVTITAVFRQTPAEEAGMIVGDRIRAVDGVDARDWTLDQARDSIRGEVGTVVRVTVDRDGIREPLTFPIRRDEVHVSAVTATTLHDSLGYIQVDRIARGSATEVDSAFALLRDTKGIILDLRRNPGGYLVESLSMADLFLDRGMTLASARSRDPGKPGEMQEDSWQARLPARIQNKTLVVLVDRFTASAAEIVAGAIQDHDRAVVMGERTFGKGVVQTVLPLPGGRRIRLTTGSWFTPMGRSLHIARDGQGRPLVGEDPDSIPYVTTPAGRKLRSDGGVYPDLTVDVDTLTSVEQTLLVEASNAGIPLIVRIEEFAFEQAQQARDTQGVTAPEAVAAFLDDGALQDFLKALEDEGLSSETLQDPQAVAYLTWRTRMSIARRMDDQAHALEYQAERDPVLAEAITLLQAVDSQTELFAAVEARSQGMGAEPQGR